MSARRTAAWGCGAVACVLAWGATTGEAAAQLRLSAPAELASGLRIPFTISGAPVGSRIVIERRGAGGWHPARERAGDPAGATGAPPGAGAPPRPPGPPP